MTAKITVTRGDETPPKPGKDTIYIDVDDDITTIIDKVEAAKQKVVALVLPKRAGALQSVVNMRLLKRASENATKNVVLITSEASILPLAGAAGLHVAKTLQSKPDIPPPPSGLKADEPAPPVPDGIDEDEIDDKKAKLDYHRSIGELAAVHAADDVITLDEPKDELPEPKVPKSTAPKQAMSQKIKVPNFERFRLMMAAGIVGVVALIVFIILALFVLPKATVTITTSSIPVSASLTLDASDKNTTLDEAANKIPASLKATKQTSNQQVQATGQQNNGDKAGGSIKLSNCTNSPVTIPAGTGVSAGNLTYITQNSLALDSGNFTSGGACKSTGSHIGTVTVKAQQGGSNYNGTHSGYSVAGYPGVSGADTSSSGMSGGTDNNTTVVSQTDLDNAKQKLTSASSDDFTKKFEQQLAGQGLYVLSSTLKLSDPQVTSTPSLGQAASTVSVTVTITYSVLTVQKTDLKKIISDSLNKQIDKSKQKLSTNDVLAGASVSIKSQASDTAAQLEVDEDTTAIPIIDTAQVKSIAAGHKSGDIKSAISGWPGVKSVDVKLSPFWVSKAPGKQSKINVKMVQVKD